MSFVFTTTQASFKSALTAGAVALALAGAAVSSAAPADAAVRHHGGHGGAHRHGGGHRPGGFHHGGFRNGGFHRYGGFHRFGGFDRHPGFGHRFGYGFGRPYGAYGFHRLHRPWRYGVRPIGFAEPVFLGRPVLHRAFVPYGVYARRAC